jgi:hypothetical protein
MGVRNYLPDSIAFVVTVCVGGKRLRVEVILDLQERLMFTPLGLLPDIAVRLPAFTEQLSEIAANHLAYQKWDGQDSLTEYQRLFLLARYQTTRNHLRFNVVLGESHLLHVGELDGRSRIQLDA